jgi:hypothetical protein
MIRGVMMKKECSAHISWRVDPSKAITISDENCHHPKGPASSIMNWTWRWQKVTCDNSIRRQKSDKRECFKPCTKGSNLITSERTKKTNRNFKKAKKN